jgi:hypothetical protein
VKLKYRLYMSGKRFITINKIRDGQMNRLIIARSLRWRWWGRGLEVMLVVLNDHLQEG